MNKPTPMQDLTAGAVLTCAACWLALVYGVVRWWRGDLNDLDEIAASMARHPAGKGRETA